MDTEKHNLPSLFRQLGLPSDQADIAEFVDSHRPLADAVRLADAPFWSQAQAQFLREEIYEDADWAEVVDQLNLMLRE
jgi:hypothetical protein